ncbi:MAG: RagB/SusD family nutrient uptake outer membrane protein [Cyclobacteriaceae bacterium]|nr:RagB/SusD family nutrient uptake outer membrane protein [Cyclobacteriaceae bacterium]
MKKSYRILTLLLAIFAGGACNQVLDLESLSEPTDATFFTNAQELDLAITGVYNSVIWQGGYSLPMQVNMDNAATDIGLVRGDYAGFEELGAGSHSASTNGFKSVYSHLYRGIGRANNLLQNMDRAKDVVPEAEFNEIKGQALVLRAYFYHYLIELFGDVPYTEELAKSPADALLPRVSKATIAETIMADLDAASVLLPDTQSDPGRITKGFAQGLKARIALYNGKYPEAASSAKAIIDQNIFKLESNYEKLFSRAGESSQEIMFVMPFKEGFATTQFPLAQGSRNRGAYSTVVPTQSMIDSYEAIDGLPIDESAIYDPSKPFENRDPRLKSSIITPQSVWAGLIFESHKDSVTFINADGTPGGGNKDCRKVSWPAAFCGYLWKKYTDEEAQKINQVISDQNFTLMRFAEILLIYAEAKVELGEIDASVLTAINRVRARAYGAELGNTAAYPAITTTDQEALRIVIRRERKVELANEGFRLFDIRRWRIADKVVPVTLYGRILNTATATMVPSIDSDGFVSYSGVESQFDLNTDQRFPNAQNRIFTNPRDYLLPIPQAEIDTYRGLGSTIEQNQGGY